MDRWIVTGVTALLATAAFGQAKFAVVVLVFERVEDIDFSAPIEVLHQQGAHIFTVAVTRDPITTVAGVHMTPDYDLHHAPAADLILNPGGAWRDGEE